MSKASRLSDVQLKAVMSEEELLAWEALPAAEQLARLRKAIDDGIKSGVSDRTMDDVWNEAMKRNPNAKL